MTFNKYSIIVISLLSYQNEQKHHNSGITLTYLPSINTYAPVTGTILDFTPV